MEITLHLGTFKTATTSLQRIIRDSKPRLLAQGIDVYAGTYSRNYKQVDILHRYLRGNGELQAARNVLQQILASSQERKIVSEEMLLGDLQCGPNLYGVHLKRFFDALPFRQGDSLKVIMTVRRIDKLLESLYLHNYSVAYTNLDFSVFYKNLDLESLSWLKIIDYIAAQPAVSSVEVIPFELCQLRPEAYTRRFFTACGVSEIIGNQPLPRENASVPAETYRLIKAVWDSEIPKGKKPKIVQNIGEILKGQPGAPPDFFGPKRIGLLRSWEDDSRILLQKYARDYAADVQAAFLGNSA